MLRGVTGQLDELQSQRRLLEPAEQSKREALNSLRGVPKETKIDVETDHIAGGNGRDAVPGEQEALDAYLTVALELQTLEAKEKLFNEQLERLKARKADKSKTE